MLLAVVSCLEIYWLDPAHFFSAPGSAWQATLLRTKVKLDPLTDIDVLFMIDKSIKGGMWHAIHGYVKANDKYMKDYYKKKESS